MKQFGPSSSSRTWLGFIFGLTAKSIVEECTNRIITSCFKVNDIPDDRPMHTALVRSFDMLKSLCSRKITASVGQKFFHLGHALKSAFHSDQ